MKNLVKFLMAAAVCCLSLSNAFAQRPYYDDREGTVASYFDLHLGEGVGHGARAIGGANVSFLYRLSPEFQFGVGAGVDYVHALALQGGQNKQKDYDYHGELTLPVFMRGRYALGGSGYYDNGAQFFVQCDLGYRIGLSAYNTGKQSGAKNIAKNFENCNVKGLFFEPQIGIAPNRTLSFSFGLPFQRYFKNISPVSVTIVDENTKIDTKSLFFMGADLHVMISF